MKNINITGALFLYLIGLFLSAPLLAQQGNKQSPAAMAAGKTGAASIQITYSSPSVKGRKIWGYLVPYKKVWRAGADEATTFATDRDILVEGKKLPAGTYSIFAIPTEDEWVIIFNKVAKQWGAYQYDQKQDALRVIVCPVRAPQLREKLTYEINEGGFTLQWENLIVPVSVKEAVTSPN